MLFGLNSWSNHETSLVNTEFSISPDCCIAELSEGNIYYQLHTPPSNFNGQTVVLVNGFGAPSFIWEEVREDLIHSGFQVLVFDHYGTGFSDKPKMTYDKDLYVSEIHQLLNKLTIEQPVHLVGHSMGGAIAGFFTDQYPNRIASLVLIAPAGFGNSSEKIFSDNSMFLTNLGDWAYSTIKGSMYVFTSDDLSENNHDSRAIPASKFVKLFLRQIKHKGYIRSLISTAKNFEMYSLLEMYERISILEKPLLVIWGNKDGLIPYAQHVKLMELFPQAELITIEEGRHNIPYRNPTQVASPILSFFSTQSNTLTF